MKELPACLRPHFEPVNPTLLRTLSETFDAITLTGNVLKCHGVTRENRSKLAMNRRQSTEAWFTLLDSIRKRYYGDPITGLVWDDRNCMGFRGRAFRPPRENA